MLVALYRSRANAGSSYQEATYGMTARSHRRFALVSGFFALVFVAGIFWETVPTLPLFALFTVLAILYAASFVRGATGEDE